MAIQVNFAGLVQITSLMTQSSRALGHVESFNMEYINNLDLRVSHTQLFVVSHLCDLIPPTITVILLLRQLILVFVIDESWL